VAARHRSGPARLVLLLLGGLGLLGGWRVARVVRDTWEDLAPPRQPVPPRPPATLPGAAAVSLTTADGLALRGWYVPSRGGAAVAVFHGLGANRLQLLPVVEGLARRGYGLLLLDLRAHGESEGRRTSLGRLEQLDVAAAVAFLAARPEVDPRRIGAVGFSMGAMALALEAAGDPRVAALALAGMPPSLEEMVRIDEPGPRGDVALLALRAAGVAVDEVRPGEALCRLAPRPILLVYGDRDPQGTRAAELRAGACGPVRLVTLPGVDHQAYATAGRERFAAELGSFLGWALAAPP